MTANPNHPRTLMIPATTTWRAEEGPGFRVYIASIPGKGETRIEVAWSGVERFEECVVGRVLGQPVPAEGFAVCVSGRPVEPVFLGPFESESRAQEVAETLRFERPLGVDVDVVGHVQCAATVPEDVDGLVALFGRPESREFPSLYLRLWAQASERLEVDVLWGRVRAEYALRRRQAVDPCDPEGGAE